MEAVESARIENGAVTRTLAAPPVPSLSTPIVPPTDTTFTPVSNLTELAAFALGPAIVKVPFTTSRDELEMIAAPATVEYTSNAAPAGIAPTKLNTVLATVYRIEPRKLDPAPVVSGPAEMSADVADEVAVALVMVNEPEPVAVTALP